jgi:hypothetical protein
MVYTRAATREGRDGRVKGFKVIFEKGCECGASGVELCGGLEVTVPHDTVCGETVGHAKFLRRYFGIEAGHRCGMKLRRVDAYN